MKAAAVKATRVKTAEAAPAALDVLVGSFDGLTGYKRVDVAISRASSEAPRRDRNPALPLGQHRKSAGRPRREGTALMDSTANLARDHLLVQPAIAASVVAAGTDRSSATPLLATWARVVSVPAGSGVRLPPAVGLEVVVVRADPSNGNELAVYANGTDAISSGSLVTLDGAQESAAVFRPPSRTTQCHEVTGEGASQRAYAAAK